MPSTKETDEQRAEQVWKEVLAEERAKQGCGGCLFRLPGIAWIAKLLRLH